LSVSCRYACLCSGGLARSDATMPDFGAKGNSHLCAVCAQGHEAAKPIRYRPPNRTVIPQGGVHPATLMNIQRTNGA